MKGYVMNTAGALLGMTLISLGCGSARGETVRQHTFTDNGQGKLTGTSCSRFSVANCASVTGP